MFGLCLLCLVFHASRSPHFFHLTCYSLSFSSKLLSSIVMSTQVPDMLPFSHWTISLMLYLNIIHILWLLNFYPNFLTSICVPDFSTYKLLRILPLMSNGHLKIKAETRILMFFPKSAPLIQFVWIGRDTFSVPQISPGRP